MNFLRIAVVAAVMIGLFFVASPIELRKDRWWRLVLALPFLWVFSGLFFIETKGASLAAGYGAMLPLSCLVAVAIIWCGPFAHYGSRASTKFLYGDGRGGGGFRPDYRHAEALIKEGKLKEALKELEEELSKSEADYPGRMLHAALQCELKNPDAALRSLDLVLRSTSLTPQQRDQAVRARREAELAKIKLDDERQRGVL